MHQNRLDVNTYVKLGYIVRNQRFPTSRGSHPRCVCKTDKQEKNSIYHN
jgi:hypothetical protein